MRLRFVVALIAAFLPASLMAQQETGANVQPPGGHLTTDPVGEYEVKVVPGEGTLVRKKGTQKWTPSSMLNEPIVVGMLDGNQKIYVVTKAIKPPKSKHTPEPDYPAGEKQKGTRGDVNVVCLHLVVDDRGMVRMPKVDASPSPEFATTAIETVKKWTFEPAKWSDQPIAVLVQVEIHFSLY